MSNVGKIKKEEPYSLFILKLNRIPLLSGLIPVGYMESIGKFLPTEFVLYVEDLGVS